MSGNLSTFPVKHLTTVSGKGQKTVNQNQEKTYLRYSVTVVTVENMSIPNAGQLDSWDSSKLR